MVGGQSEVIRQVLPGDLIQLAGGLQPCQNLKGGKGGGGSRLTDGAREFMQKYEQYRDACYRENQRIFQEIFSEELEEEQ